jgi:hypothetical protein
LHLSVRAGLLLLKRVVDFDQSRNCRPAPIFLGSSTAIPISTRSIRQAREEVELIVFDILAVDDDDLRDLPLSMRKANRQPSLPRQPDDIFGADFEQGEIGAAL